MKFLIPTDPHDTHAMLVKHALEKKGHQVTLVFAAEESRRQINSVFIDVEHCSWQNTDRFDVVLDHDYDVVWWRRDRKPHLPPTIEQPDDFRFVVREHLLFYESVKFNMAPNAWWVNSKEAANRANFKILQLHIASECGMSIPTTLCSSDSTEISSFLLNHVDEGVVCKPLCVDGKQSDPRLPGSVIDCETPSNRLISQQSPSIFQTEVKKKHSIRVTCFGDHLVAAKLNSQEQAVIEPYALSNDLTTKIRRFMHELGIVFGTFDFSVTPDDEYIFHELNEQGQFLWMEEQNPKLRMLDIFVNFLVNKSVDFHAM